jgi:hypothetical protein
MFAAAKPLKGMTGLSVMPLFFGGAMQNDQETANDSVQPDPNMAGQDDTAAAVRAGKGSAGDGVSESDCPQRPPRATRARKDKGLLHARRHSILSRYPLEALVRRGENLRELRQIEKMLRAELKPVGILAELLFDRAWSSFLRCLLIARTEARLFTPVNQNDANGEPELKEAELQTLVWPEPGTTNYDFSRDLITQLETVLRYDGHHTREFHRSVVSLLALRDGGVRALLDCL